MFEFTVTKTLFMSLKALYVPRIFIVSVDSRLVPEYYYKIVQVAWVGFERPLIYATEILGCQVPLYHHGDKTGSEKINMIWFKILRLLVCFLNSFMIS